MKGEKYKALAGCVAILVTLFSIECRAGSISHGGDTIRMNLEEARLLALDAVQEFQRGSVKRSQGVSRTATEILDRVESFVQMLRDSSFVVISPSGGDSPLRDSATGRRVEASVDPKDASIIKVDRDLVGGYGTLRLAKLLIHEGGHLLGLGAESEKDLDQFAILVLRSVFGGVLDVSSILSTNRILVPSPYGQLLVRGKPTRQVREFVQLYRCESSYEAGIPDKHSCNYAGLPRFNEPKRLSAGFYQLSFSESEYPGLVEVKRGETTVVTLRELQIPKVGKDVVIAVYRDPFFDGEMEKQYMIEWGASENRDVWNYWCKLITGTNGQLCKLIIGGSYAAFRRESMYFLQPSSEAFVVTRYDVARDEFVFTSVSLRRVATVSPGDSVLVFPGKYRIEYQAIGVNQIDNVFVDAK